MGGRRVDWEDCIQRTLSGANPKELMAGVESDGGGRSRIVGRARHREGDDQPVGESNCVSIEAPGKLSFAAISQSRSMPGEQAARGLRREQTTTLFPIAVATAAAFKMGAERRFAISKEELTSSSQSPSIVVGPAHFRRII